MYFNFTIALAGGLLVLWHYGHPAVLQNITSPEIAEVAQVYILAAVVAAQGVNQAVIGPLTSKCVVRYLACSAAISHFDFRTMFKRHKLEKEEGKSYNDPGVCANYPSSVSHILNDCCKQVSGAMRSLNRTFSQLHGISSLLNMGAFISIAFHGLWIANKGVGNI